MHEVGICKGGKPDKLALGGRCLGINIFWRTSIDGLHPIILGGLWAKDFFMVGDLGPEPDSSMGALAKVAHQSLEPFQMPLARGHSESGQGHHSLGHIKSAQGDGPLDCSNEGLVPLNVMWATKGGII